VNVFVLEFKVKSGHRGDGGKQGDIFTLSKKEREEIAVQLKIRVSPLFYLDLQRFPA